MRSIFLFFFFFNSLLNAQDLREFDNPLPPQPRPVYKKTTNKKTINPTKAKKPKLTLKELWDPSGSLRLGYFQKDKTFSPNKDYLVGSTWLTLRPKLLWGFKSYFQGTLQNSDMLRDKTIYGDLREGYFDISIGPFDLRAGRLITVWGRADKVNPTDTLSLKDLTRLTTDDEDQRIGIGSAQIIYNFLSEFRLIFISQPEWRNPQFPIPPLPTGVSLSNSTPESSLGQYAVKLDRTGGDIDFSLSYFNGYDKFPDFKILSLTSTSLNLGLDYNKIVTYGFDAAANLGVIGIRTEGAYTKTKDDTGADPLIKNPFYFAVLGADRVFFEKLTLGAQYLFRSIENWVDSQTLSPSFQSLAALTQRYSNQQQKSQQGYTARIEYKAMNDNLTCELTFLQWLQNQDSLFRPKMNYSFTDHFKLAFGAEIYSGPDDSFLGQFKAISGGFLETRYDF